MRGISKFLKRSDLAKIRPQKHKIPQLLQRHFSVFVLRD